MSAHSDEADAAAAAGKMRSITPQTIDDGRALELLGEWLDVHPGRDAKFRKVSGKVHAYLTTDYTGKQFSSKTQETLGSAIRTVLGAAYAEGEK